MKKTYIITGLIFISLVLFVTAVIILEEPPDQTREFKNIKLPDNILAP
ncbi:hypothetical protein [Metabacillus fastidiosus]